MRSFARSTLVLVIFLAAVSAARACSVCQGDPDSDLVKGAQGGVIVMVMVTYAVLVMFAGMVTFWVVRTRRLRRIDPATPPPTARED